MSHYWIELAVWLLVAYAVGCLLGWLLKNLGKSPAPAATLAAAPAALAAAPTAKERPKGTAAARDGKPDNS